jgi:hypothetical protein
LDQINAYFSDVDATQGPVTPEQVADLLERVRELPPNPIPDPDGVDSAQARSELETRRGPMSIDERPTSELPKTEPVENTSGSRGFVVAAAVAAVVLIVGVGSWALFATDETTFGTDDALSVADSYFEEYNAGNDEAVVALLTPDATVTWFSRSRSEWEMITAFFVGQGTILSPPECTVTEEVLGASATVFCDFETHSGVMQAVGAPPVSTSFIAVVTPDGIDRLTFSHGQPDFLDTGLPFEQWIAENHPEAIEATALWDWATLEEARQTGVVTAQFAEEWATYLDENDCTFVDGC